MAKLMKISPFAFGNTPTKLKDEVDIRCLKEYWGNARPKGMGMFSILTQEDGDKRIIWDALNISEVQEARQLFLDLIAKGFKPYRIDPKTGLPTEIIMVEFDAIAEEVFMEEQEIIMAPMRHAIGG